MLMLMLLKRLPHLTATLTTSHEEEEGGAGPLTVEGWIDLREQIDSYREGRGGPALTVRKEVREMTCSEWEAFVTAMKELKAAPQWAKYASPEDEEEQQIIWDLSHSDARQDLFTFLPWHRLWLREVERELQKIDPYVTIPYWNWALDSADPLRSPVLSDMYFGGNGDPSYNHCVLDGAFKTEKKEEARDIMANNGTSSSSCIQRTFPEKSGGLLSLLNVKDILVGHEDFESLNLCLENCPGMYGYMNVWMGGKGEKHPSDPLFLSLVAYIDMLWWKWQRMHNSE
jgi:tyrosinase